MHYFAFTREWFQRHQKGLLWLLACPLIGRWFRWVLCIRPGDVGHRGRIIELLPHAYTIVNPDGTRTADFRTHWKFSKRIYYAFKPLWWALHAWDLLADWAVPEWSFGFSVLTTYPEPEPGTLTCDGILRRDPVVGEAWSSLRNGVGTWSAPATDGGGNPGVDFIATATTDVWRMISRSATLFDTSSLTSVASISAVIYSLFGIDATDGGLASDPDIDVYTVNPASNTTLVDADYDTFGSTTQSTAPIVYGSWSTSGYNDWTLSSTGIGNISKTGVTKFGVRNANYDVANAAPAWSIFLRAYFGFSFADATGTTQDPKLVVTYTIPGVEALTGVSGTASVGTSAPTHSNALTGTAGTVSVGTLGASSTGLAILTGIKIQFLVDNYFDQLSTTISASSEVSALPVRFSQDQSRAKVWRSVTGTGAATIHVDLGSVLPVDSFALANLRAIGVGVVELYELGDGSSPGAATLVAFCDVQDRDTRAVAVSFTSQSHRHWDIKLTNPGSASDYGEIGYAFLGEALIPTRSIVPRPMFVRVDPSIETTSVDGQKNFSLRTKYFRGEWKFAFIDEAGLSELREVFDTLGRAGHMFAVLDVAQPWKTVYCRVVGDLIIEADERNTRYATVSFGWEEVR